MRSWFVYLIECVDGSVYTGIAVDVERRYAQHRAGKGARYTRSHPPARLLGCIEYQDRGAALRAEYAVKKLTPERKRALCTQREQRGNFLGVTSGSLVPPAPAQGNPTGSAGQFQPASRMKLNGLLRPPSVNAQATPASKAIASMPRNSSSTRSFRSVLTELMASPRVRRHGTPANAAGLRWRSQPGEGPTKVQPEVGLAARRLGHAVERHRPDHAPRLARHPPWRGAPMYRSRNDPAGSVGPARSDTLCASKARRTPALGVGAVGDHRRRRALGPSSTGVLAPVIRPFDLTFAAQDLARSLDR